IVVPATVKEPAGGAVSLTRFSVTVFGLPSPSVSVTVNVIGPSLNAEALTGRFHQALPLMVVVALWVLTPSVITKLTADHFSPLIVGPYEVTLVELMYVAAVTFSTGGTVSFVSVITVAALSPAPLVRVTEMVIVPSNILVTSTGMTT